jgi:hypothetical protein
MCDSRIGERECLIIDHGRPGTMLVIGARCSSDKRVLTATVPKNSHAHKGESSHAQVKVSSTINQAAPAAGGGADC